MRSISRVAAMRPPLAKGAIGPRHLQRRGGAGAQGQREVERLALLQPKRAAQARARCNPISCTSRMVTMFLERARPRSDELSSYLPS